MNKYSAVLAAVALALGIASPVAAKVTFEAYEGRNALGEGEGGTKISKNGVDFWTSGTPPRRFQVLGALVDSRGDGPLSGDTIGSKAVAKKVLELGGSAVIVGGRDTKFEGTMSFPAYGADGEMHQNGMTMAKNRVTTRMVVVKYLD